MLLIIIINNSPDFNEETIRNDAYVEDSKEIKVKHSDSWDLTGSPILINGNAGWASANSTYDWCNGSGTQASPYIIENVTINGQLASSCIEIRNSNVYFIIRNCTLTKSRYNDGDAAIRLDNVDNGRIENNYLYDNGEDGIHLAGDSDNNIIFNNTIDWNDHYGIFIAGGDLNQIIDNDITRNIYGVHIEFDASSPTDNIIENNTIDDNTVYGIRIDTQGFRTIIRNNTITNTNNLDGISLYYGANDVEILNNTISSNGRYGVAVTAGSVGVIIRGNTLDNNADAGVYVYTFSRATVSYNNFSNNDYSILSERSYGSNIFSNNLGDAGIGLIGDEPRFFDHTIALSNLVNDKSVYYYSQINGLSEANFMDPGQILLARCNNSVISNQNISSSSVGIGIYYCNYNQILNNTIENQLKGLELFKSNHSIIKNNTISNSGQGIHVNDCTNNTLVNNTAKLNSKGIYVEYTQRHLITENTANNNTQEGIMLDYCDNGNNVTFNTALYNGVGISLYGSDLNIVANNSANHNKKGIIVEYRSDFNLIANNTINNNTQNGIVLKYYCNNNTITRNILLGNNRGFYLLGSSFGWELMDNNITYNLLTQNNYGLYLDEYVENNNIVNNTFKDNFNHGVYISQATCSGNFFYNNSFIGNTINARSVSTNYWNSSEIGNYWDDYIGYDANGDGIGETPYTNNGVNDELPICYRGITDPPGIFTILTDADNPDDDGIFRINWTISAGADYYSIYWWTDNITMITLPSANLIIDGLTNFSMLIPKMQDGTYYFAVVAYNASGLTISKNLIIVVDTRVGDGGDDDDDNGKKPKEGFDLVEFLTSPIGLTIIGVSGGAVVAVILFIRKRKKKLNPGTLLFEI